MLKQLSRLSLFLLFCACSGAVSEPPFPIFLQEYPYQCGPVCLKMIMNHYGENIDLQTLETCSKMDTLEGTSLLGLTECAETLGYKSKGVKVSFEALVTEVPLPTIAHWDKNHFVVVYKVTPAKVWVADPALGKMEYDPAEFCTHWHRFNTDGVDQGVLLLLEKTGDEEQ